MLLCVPGLHGAVSGLDQLVLYMAVVDHLHPRGEQREVLRRHLNPLVQTFNPVGHAAVWFPHDLVEESDLIWREFVERLEMPVLLDVGGEIPHDVTADHLQHVLG